MIERLSDLPHGIVGVKAVGKVSKEDYERIIVPLLDEALRDGTRLRVLCEVNTDFAGFTAAGAWEDVKLGLQSIRSFEGYAVVSDISWIREATRVAAFFMPCPVSVFTSAERGRAIEWLGALPEHAAVTHRLVVETGVMVVEVNQPLRASDFDALTLAADSWIDAHGKLNGLVIHTREFPGWENLRGLIRHIRFVRDHHRKIRRIALAADTKLASLGSQLAEHFIDSEIKTFEYDGVDEAIAWAGRR